MHPFYGPSQRLVGGRETSGLLSMVAYLAFWAVAIALAKRELDARFPRVGRPAAFDPAVAVLRERLARGDIEVTEYRERLRELEPGAGGRP